MYAHTNQCDVIVQLLTVAVYIHVHVHVHVHAYYASLLTGATVVEFAPPPSLHPSLISSVHVSMLPGGAVMIVERVKRGHAGVYTCQARGDSMKELKQSVELVVNTGIYKCTCTHMYVFVFLC